MSAYDTDTAAFVNWVKSVGTSQFSSKIEVRDLRESNQGRGVYAIEDIAEGEVLFEISRDKILNVETCTVGKDHPGMQDVLLDEVSAWEGLVFCILFEWRVRKDESLWKDYFQVLPKQSDMNELVYWTDAELAKLAPSSVVSRVGKDDAVNLLKTIKSLVKRFNIVAMEDVTVEDVMYVGTIIMAYSFDVENHENNQDDSSEEFEEDDDEGEENNVNSVRESKMLKSMVPLADTLNADTKMCNAHLIHGEKSLEMCSIVPIKKGEQVYNTYGDLPNSELLRKYGYVEANGTDYDFGEVSHEKVAKVLIKHYDEDGQLSTVLKTTEDILREDSKIQSVFDFRGVLDDAYECSIDGNVAIENVLLLQILVLVCQIPEVGKYSVPKLKKTLRIVVKKAYKSIEEGKITKECVVVWKEAVVSQLGSFPRGVIEPIDTKELDSNRDATKLRELMARVVVQGEHAAIRACSSSIGKQFKLANDREFLKAVLPGRAKSYV